MKCPNCLQPISDNTIARHLAAKGGRARKPITKDKAREMARLSAIARRKKCG